jgi:hypothetical protein
VAPIIECIDSGCVSNLMRVLIRLTAPDKVLLQDAVDEHDPFGTETTDDLHELLAELDVGYEHRLAAFRALRLLKFRFR